MFEKIKSADGVMNTEVQEGFYFPASVWYGDRENALPSIFLPMDQNYSMNQIEIQEQAELIDEHSIFVSIFLKYSGCKLGDTITLKSSDYEQSFQVAGFVEEDGR